MTPEHKAALAAGRTKHLLRKQTEKLAHVDSQGSEQQLNTVKATIARDILPVNLISSTQYKAVQIHQHLTGWAYTVHTIVDKHIVNSQTITYSLPLHMIIQKMPDIFADLADKQIQGY